MSHEEHSEPRLLYAAGNSGEGVSCQDEMNLVDISII